MDVRISVMFLLSYLALGLVGIGEGMAIDKAEKVAKRSAAPERSTDDYPDYQLGVKYDEYPMIVPKKRAALLIDRLMVALQKAIEEEESGGRATTSSKNYSIRSDDAVRRMDLQRRGHGGLAGQQKGRVYWRCYFNAVTCF